MTTTAEAAARRGLGAAVLVALLALLHAAFTSGTSHLPALDLDDCLRQHAVAPSGLPCDAAPDVALLDAGGDGHHGDASQSCDASADGPRQVSGPAAGAVAPGSVPPSWATPAGHAGAHGPACTRRGLCLPAETVMRC
ncbi:hypothetical protein ACWD4J_31845 [Streptomyces sp. NPDC002577]